MPAASKLTDDEQLLRAALETQARRKIRNNLDCFCLSVGCWPAAHHRLINSKLMEVVSGKLKRLMFFVGPGMGKSTYISKVFPAFLFAQPSWHGMPWEVMMTSCSASRAAEFSDDTKRIINENPLSCGYGIDPKHDVIDSWHTDKGDKYKCFGAGQDISSVRADILIGDDWIGSEEEAQSETQRDKVWRWYLRDFRMRKRSPASAMIIINTRRHEDDHCGRILPDDWRGQSGLITAKDGEVWDVVCMPSQALDNDILGREEGEYIWPEYADQHPNMTGDEWWEQEKISSGVRGWACLHQQNPAPESGGLMEEKWFEHYEERPKGMRYVLVSDFATTDNVKRDPNCHVVFGISNDNNIYIVDAVNKWMRTGESTSTALDLIAEYECQYWLNERGPIWNSVEPAADVVMRDRGIMVRKKTFPRVSNKADMCHSFITMAENGQVFLPKHAGSWADDMVREWLTYPNATHDEYVDCAALMGLFVSEILMPVRKNRHGTAQGMTVRL